MEELNPDREVRIQSMISNLKDVTKEMIKYCAYIPAEDLLIISGLAEEIKVNAEAMLGLDSLIDVNGPGNIDFQPEVLDPMDGVQPSQPNQSDSFGQQAPSAPHFGPQEPYAGGVNPQATYNSYHNPPAGYGPYVQTSSPSINEGNDVGPDSGIFVTTPVSRGSLRQNSEAHPRQSSEPHPGQSSEADRRSASTSVAANPPNWSRRRSTRERPVPPTQDSEDDAESHANSLTDSANETDSEGQVNDRGTTLASQSRLCFEISKEWERIIFESGLQTRNINLKEVISKLELSYPQHHAEQEFGSQMVNGKAVPVMQRLVTKYALTQFCNFGMPQAFITLKEALAQARDEALVMQQTTEGSRTDEPTLDTIKRLVSSAQRYENKSCLSNFALRFTLSELWKCYENFKLPEVSQKGRKEACVKELLKKKEITIDATKLKRFIRYGAKWYRFADELGPGALLLLGCSENYNFEQNFPRLLLDQFVVLVRDIANTRQRELDFKTTLGTGTGVNRCIEIIRTLHGGVIRLEKMEEKEILKMKEEDLPQLFELCT